MSSSKEPTGPGKTDPSGRAFYLWYMNQFTEHADVQLTIAEGKGVTSVIHYTEQGLPIRALGGFHLPLGFDDPDLAAIGAAIQKYNLTSPAPDDQPMTFGMMKKMFEIRADGKGVTHLLNAMEPTPDEFAIVEEKVIEVMGRVAKGPVRALAMRLDLEPGDVARRQPLKIEVTFTCLGRFPAEIPNPASFRSHPENSFRLNLWRPAKDDDGEPSWEFETTIDLVGKEFLTADKTALRSNKTLLRLEAGNSLKTWTTLTFPKMSPGEYRAELVYIASRPDGTEGDSNVIEGEMHADPLPLRVVK